MSADYDKLVQAYLQKNRGSGAGGRQRIQADRPSRAPTVEQRRERGKEDIKRASSKITDAEKKYATLVSGKNISSAQAASAIKEYSQAVAERILDREEESSKKVLSPEERAKKINAINKRVADKAVAHRMQAKAAAGGDDSTGVEFVFTGKRVGFRLIKRGRPALKDRALCIGAVFDRTQPMCAMVSVDGVPATGWLQIDDETMSYHTGRIKGENTVMYLWAGTPGACPRSTDDYCACLPVGPGVSRVVAFNPKLSPRGFNAAKREVEGVPSLPFIDISQWFVPHSTVPVVKEREAAKWAGHDTAFAENWHVVVEADGTSVPPMSHASNYIAVAESIGRLPKDLHVRVVPTLQVVPGMMQISRTGTSRSSYEFQPTSLSERTDACFQLLRMAKNMADVGVCMDRWEPDDWRLTTSSGKWDVAGLNHASMIVVKDGKGCGQIERIRKSCESLVSLTILLMGSDTARALAKSGIFGEDHNHRLEVVTAVLKLRGLARSTTPSGKTFDSMFRVWQKIGRVKSIDASKWGGAAGVDKETGLKIVIENNFIMLPLILFSE